MNIIDLTKFACQRIVTYFIENQSVIGSIFSQVISYTQIVSNFNNVPQGSQQPLSPSRVRSPQPQEKMSLETGITYWLVRYQQEFPELYQNSNPPTCESLLTHEQKEYLTFYLNELLNTQDYKAGGESRRKVILLTAQILQEAAVNPQFCDTLFPLLKEASYVCEDHLTFYSNKIEVQLALSRSDEKSDVALAQLLIGAKRVNMLEKIVDASCTSPKFLEISIHLFYQSKLRTLLKLPLSADQMLYPGKERAGRISSNKLLLRW